MGSPRDALEGMFGKTPDPLAGPTRPTGPSAGPVKEPSKPDIGSAEKVLSCLNKKSMSRDELSIASGLGDEGTAKALNYLMTKVSPPYVDKQQALHDKINDRQIRPAMYFLTSEGKAHVPKSVAAIKHFRGLNGKYRFDPEGRILLGGSMGQVLDAIRALPIPSQSEICKHTGLSTPTVSTACRDLVDKIEVVEIIYDGRTQRYKEVPLKKETEPRKPVSEQPKPAPAISPNANYAQSPIEKAMGEPLPQSKMVETVKGLIEAGYDPADIIMEALSHMTDELRSLREFHKQTLALGGN